MDLTSRQSGKKRKNKSEKTIELLLRNRIKIKGMLRKEKVRKKEYKTEKSECSALTLNTTGGGEASPVGTTAFATTEKLRLEPTLEEGALTAVVLFFDKLWIVLFCPTNADEDERAEDTRVDELRTDARRHVACARAGTRTTEQTVFIFVFIPLYRLSFEVCECMATRTHAHAE